jgi:large subunit ribosomal protein L2
MKLLFYKPYTPSRRYLTKILYSDLSKKKVTKNLLFYKHFYKGRNNEGKITIRHLGGGHKKRYRKIDFKRNKCNIFGRILSIEYDPNRTANIALVQYADCEKRYILQPLGLNLGSWIKSYDNFSELESLSFFIGNSLPLKYIPLGISVHNIELHYKKGGQIARAAGCEGIIVSKNKNFVAIKLPSGQIKLFNDICLATLGRLSNIYTNNINLGKAGKTRWLGVRPSVRGSAMNPVDHPHGGGEGKSSIGKPSPLTPWGKPTLGFKTVKRSMFTVI